MENYKEQLSNNIQKEKTHSLIQAPLWKHLACFGAGWLGLTIIANIIAFFASFFIHKDSIPEAELDLVLTKFSFYINFASYSILIVALFLILGLPLLKRIFKDFTIGRKIGKGILFGLLAMGVSVGYNMITSILFPYIGSNANQEGVNSFILAMPILSFFMVVIFAPITEELTYRFGLFGALYKKNRTLALILTSLIFGLIHTPFLSLDVFELTAKEWIIELINFPGYCLSGFVLCLAYEKNESLASSISAHAFNNFVAFFMTFLAAGLEQIDGALRIL